jgi:hypothetical protein
MKYIGSYHAIDSREAWAFGVEAFHKSLQFFACACQSHIEIYHKKAVAVNILKVYTRKNARGCKPAFATRKKGGIECTDPTPPEILRNQ